MDTRVKQVPASVAADWRVEIARHDVSAPIVIGAAMRAFMELPQEQRVTYVADMVVETQSFKLQGESK